jgi:hypothetical protein
MKSLDCDVQQKNKFLAIFCWSFLQDVAPSAVFVLEETVFERRFDV